MATRFGFRFGQTFGYNEVIGGGTVSLSPLQLASAFAVFANQGRAMQPQLIDTITVNGQVLFQAKPQGRVVLEPAIAYSVLDGLVGVVRDPQSRLARGARIKKLAVGCKTGTTGNKLLQLDLWGVCVTPSSSTVLWLGNHDNSPLETNLDSTFNIAVIGDFLRQRNLQEPNFERPEGVFGRKVGQIWMAEPNER
jgi:membrane peptidoglycan carboxypeptidase